MTRRFLLVLSALCLMTTAAWAATSGESLAPDRVGRWDFGMNVASAMNDDVDDDAYFSGAISYGVTPYIGLGVEAGWQEADSEAANEESVGAVPVLFDIILRIPTVHESVVPYGVLGLGVIGVYVTNENGGPATLEGDDVDDTGFGWKLGGGLDWFLDNNWILNFEFAFLSADADLPTSSLGADGDFDFWTLGIGLKYAF